MPAYPGAPRCFSCETEISADALNTADPVPCASCAKPLHTCVFPALHRNAIAASAEMALEEDSTCFYHPDKRAAICCDNCGRFLCVLCDIDFEGKHFCPGCLNNAPTSEIKTTLRNEGFNYDWMAFLTGYMGWMICWCVIGPATCYMVIRYWNARTPFSSSIWFRVRMLLALLVGLAFTAAMIGYTALILYGISELSHKPQQTPQTRTNTSGDNSRPLVSG